MGLCPSRNQAALKQTGQTYTPLPPAPARPQLRADAAAFVPVPEKPKEKEPWEAFLEQKQHESVAPKGAAFARKVDGTFTADYRRLLDNKPDRKSGKYVPPHQRQASTGADWVQEWKTAGPRSGPKRDRGVRAPAPPPGLAPKTGRSAKPCSESDAKLKAALQLAKSLSPSRDVVLAELAAMEPAKAKDDGHVPSGLVPFGLTDSCYLSDGNDTAQSCRHTSSRPCKPKPYAKAHPTTPDLEERMTKVLHNLRVLKAAEHRGEDLARRYCVGIREVARALKDKQHCGLRAILVAPDVEPDSKTTRGSLDERLSSLLSAAAELKIPIVYGLSRQRIGQAIKKNVTISVLGVLNVRGMEASFQAMLQAAT